MSDTYSNSSSVEEDAAPSTQSVPFFTQSAVLARYAYQADPRADAVALRVVLDVLRQNKELRRRFFELRPSPAWIPILWDEQFFHTPPQPEEAPGGQQWFLFWDVQWFLTANASEMPDYVLLHLELLDEIQAAPAFRAASMKAVQALVPHNLKWVHRALPTIKRWMEDVALAHSLSHDALALVEALAQHQDQAAFDLLRAIAQPHPNSNAKSIGEEGSVINAEAVTAMDSRYLRDSEEGQELLSTLRRWDFEALVRLWEQLLLEALAVEAKTRGYDDEEVGDSTWWRNAIEDTNQDIGFDYKHLLLAALRDTLEEEGREDAARLRAHVDIYLNHPRQILRRVGMHLLRTFPQPFLALVEEKLLEAANYEDTGIHHEFFGLLADGFPLLSDGSRLSVLQIILAGPSRERLDQIVEWSLSRNGGDAGQLRLLYQQIWQRDRLWVIREHLPHAERRYLSEITARLKEPEHPSFTSYSSGAFFVSSVSPLSREQLRALTPDQMFELLSTWQPPSKDGFGPEEVNWEGLTSEVGQLVRGDLPRYADWIVPLAKLRPRLALALVNIALALEKPAEPQRPARRGIFRGGRARGRRRSRVVDALPQEPANRPAPIDEKGELATVEPQLAAEAPASQSEGDAINNEGLWELRLTLVEGILSDPELRVDMAPSFDGGWPHVRRELVSLLKGGLEADDERQVPEGLLPRVRDALLTLADDPDPTRQGDRPAEGWSGHNDPLHVAINHVRPEAISALVAYAACRSRRGLDGHPPIGIGPARLESFVSAKLAERLSRQHEFSWAVQSVFGRHLCNLYWLDKPWVEAHLDDIFPPGEDEESLWYFAAAWDSYVVSNRHLFLPLFERMRPLYVRAIEAMERGFVTSTYLERTKQFAGHLIIEYFHAPYDLRAPAGESNLLRLFFEKASPEARGEAAWRFWRTVADAHESDDSDADLVESPNSLAMWRSARDFWQWRAGEASQKGHPSDFDPEMEWLVFLVNCAPESESIASLFQLLSATLPHLQRGGARSHAWDDLESFLAREVKRDPETSIRFYAKMHTQLDRPLWSRHENAMSLLETALNNNDARVQALDLLDLMARRGIPGFDDLYQKWLRPRL
jgi:hypothetical protein